MPILPLVDGVLRYTKENKISLCMPGHKGGLGFKDTDYGRKLYENFINCDVTEVDGLDNLHSPKGIIKESQEMLRDYYKSKKSYFLVNGSTSGNLAMIFASFNEGDKVLVERNCHRSISNGIILRKLIPIYIKNNIHSEYDAPMSIDMEHLIHSIENNSDAKGIIITYPNYYGVCTDLEKIIQVSKSKGMKVLVDSAHGAHFVAYNGLPKCAVRLGADMVVMSAHKTLPSLNQASFLHVNNDSLIKKVDFYVSVFLSTSPSYMIMCSMDYARAYLQEEGGQAYSELLSRAKVYRGLINKIPHMHVLDEKDIGNIDLSRYVINIEKGYNAEKVSDHLKENKIQPELCDGRNIVLIFSPFNKDNDFRRVYEVLKEYVLEYEEPYEVVLNDIPEMVCPPYLVVEKNNRWINLEEAVGKICAGAIVPYPPGIPIVTLGERIEEKQIVIIKKYLEKETTILGVENYKILILEDTSE